MRWEDRPRDWSGDFPDYIRLVDPEYQFAPHMERLQSALQRVADGECTRLIVSMPPRHGKSRTISELFPAYYSGRFPWHKVIIASYEEGLAVEFSSKVKETIDSPLSPNTDVRTEGRAKGDLSFHGWPGVVYAAGVFGGITGRGAHLLIVDDPIKDQQWADSPVRRQGVYEWFTGVAMRRLENQLAELGESSDGKRKAACIIVHTRWHDDDLAGRLLTLQKNNPEAEQWEYLNLPALAEENDPLGRAEGEALWEERYSRNDLLVIRANTPPRIWGAQYQGKPLTAGARLFPEAWFNNRYDLRVLPAYEMVIQVVDAAWKKGVDNSYSVIATWGRSQFSYDLLDIWRDRVTYPSLLNAIRDNYWKWHPFGVDGTLIEDAASGTSAIQSLQEEEGDERGMVNAIPFDVDGVNQYYFVEGATPFFMARRVRLPQYAPWLADWIAEHVNYPTALNDDQVVTTAMGIRFLSGGRTSRKDDEDLSGFGKVGASAPTGATGDTFGKKGRR